MKYFIFAIAAFVLFGATGCGIADKATTNVGGHVVKCVDHVEYVVFARGASVKYNQDGSISTC